MRVLRIILFVGLALPVLGCNFDFLNNSDLGIVGDNLEMVQTDIAGGYRQSWYNRDGELQYYEDFMESGGRVVEQQHYNAAGVLQYAYAYGYDGDGNKNLTAWYNADKVLGWYKFSVWTDGRISSITEYDSSNVMQNISHYQYSSDPAPEADGKLVLYAWRNSSGEIAGGYTISYDAQFRPQLRTSYGDQSRTLSGARSLLGLTLPAAPAPESIPPAPTEAGLQELQTSGYAYWVYDGYGNTALTFDKDWYPLSMTREDSRLSKTASVQLSWDEANRISRKKSYYGSTLALDVGINYSNDGFPQTISTSGAAMLLPLAYTITYDGDHIPTRLDVHSSGALLQYFTIAYDGPAVSLNPENLPGLDPFSFLDSLAASNLAIEHYDGDSNLMETFDFNVISTGLRVDVYNSSDSLNGYYLVAYNDDELAASISAHAANGSEQWSYSYGYADVDVDAVLLAASTFAASDYGRLAETLITEDIANYAKGFVMDLLF